jgi:hypothetical protein
VTLAETPYFTHRGDVVRTTLTGGKDICVPGPFPKRGSAPDFPMFRAPAIDEDAFMIADMSRHART